MKPVYLTLSMPFDKVDGCGSRFWGNPDLPADMDFPSYIDEDGDECHYCFICQINLEQLAAFAPDNPLPHKGLLSFFAKIDHYLGRFEYYNDIGGYISDPEDVKILFFPECDDSFREVVLVDDDDKPIAPSELQIDFAHSIEQYGDDHALFAFPSHREWETWDSPYEDWMILLQVDSFCGMDFNLNFMDFGVLDFLISPDDLKHQRFDNVRAIVLST